MSEQTEAVVSTHEAVAKKLRDRKQAATIDITKLASVKHNTADETFYVGPMDYEGHRQWHEIRRFEEIQHENANRTNEDPVNRSKSDKLLLSKAVFTEDGLAISELAELLLNLEGAGPDNFKLLSEAERANPPREQLAAEVTQLLNLRTIDTVLWRLLIEGGLIKVLIDYMSTHASNEEREWAERELVKAEEIVYAFQGLFEAEDLASTMGITFKSALKLVATHGDADKAMTAAQIESDAEPEL